MNAAATHHPSITPEAARIISELYGERGTIGRANFLDLLDRVTGGDLDGDLLGAACGALTNIEDTSGAGADDYDLFDDCVRAQWPDLGW
jgi:hypothetical protein